MGNWLRVVAWMLAGLTGSAEAAGRMEVTSLKPLLIAAVTQGEAHGTFVGPLADRVHEKFGSSAPILIDVRVVGSLPQENCKRLEVKTSQDGVHEVDSKTKAASMRDAKLGYNISYCADGTFPKKGPAK